MIHSKVLKERLICPDVVNPFQQLRISIELIQRKFEETMTDASEQAYLSQDTKIQKFYIHMDIVNT